LQRLSVAACFKKRKNKSLIHLIPQGFENFLEKNVLISGFNVPSYVVLSDKG